MSWPSRGSSPQADDQSEAVNLGRFLLCFFSNTKEFACPCVWAHCTGRTERLWGIEIIPQALLRREMTRSFTRRHGVLGRFRVIGCRRRAGGVAMDLARPCPQPSRNSQRRRGASTGKRLPIATASTRLACRYRRRRLRSNPDIADSCSTPQRAPIGRHSVSGVPELNQTWSLTEARVQTPKKRS